MLVAIADTSCGHAQPRRDSLPQKGLSWRLGLLDIAAT
jgi:hypothetical protein